MREIQYVRIIECVQTDVAVGQMPPISILYFPVDVEQQKNPAWQAGSYRRSIGPKRKLYRMITGGKLALGMTLE